MLPKICKTSVRPFTQDIKLIGAEVGSTTHLRPILILQYHVLPNENVDPYVGLDVNRALYFNEAPVALKLVGALGVLAQAGVDLKIGRSRRLCVDSRYIQNESDGDVSGSVIGKV